MADADTALAWPLASFHVAALLVAGLTTLYAVGALGSLLQGVRTVTGLALYLALWGLTRWTVGRWLRAAALDASRDALLGAATWGAVTGVGFLFAVLVTLGVVVREFVFVAVLALVGTPVAALVGGVVGVGFAFLDTLLVRLGTRFGAA